jgi:hypothetical protein
MIDSLYRVSDTEHELKELPMTDLVRRTLRRLDRWTLTVFNPYIASDHPADR